MYIFSTKGCRDSGGKGNIRKRHRRSHRHRHEPARSRRRFPRRHKRRRGLVESSRRQTCGIYRRACKNLRDEYENFDKKSALKTFREKSYLTGKDVNVRDLFGTYKARVLDIDDDFGLVVMKEDGVSVLRSGVVSISVIKEE